MKNLKDTEMMFKKNHIEKTHDCPMNQPIQLHLC